MNDLLWIKSIVVTVREWTAQLRKIQMHRNAFIVALFATLSLLCVPVLLLAEPKPERQDAADQIVLATVKAVYSRIDKAEDKDRDSYTRYLIQLEVTKSVKGKAEQGDTLYVHCYKVIRPQVNEGASGHSKIPKQGERIEVYLREVNGRLDGLYPDWYQIK